MSKKSSTPPPRDWTKAQPHHVVTGNFTSRAYAEKNPDKVEWVKGKND